MPGSLRSLAILAAGSLLVGFSEGSWMLGWLVVIGFVLIVVVALRRPRVAA